jgi:hypothetical protein
MERDVVRNTSIPLAAPGFLVDLMELVQRTFACSRFEENMDMIARGMQSSQAPKG